MICLLISKCLLCVKWLVCSVFLCTHDSHKTYVFVCGRARNVVGLIHPSELSTLKFVFVTEKCNQDDVPTRSDGEVHINLRTDYCRLYFGQLLSKSPGVSYRQETKYIRCSFWVIVQQICVRRQYPVSLRKENRITQRETGNI